MSSASGSFVEFFRLLDRLIVVELGVFLWLLDRAGGSSIRGIIATALGTVPESALAWNSAGT